MPFVGIAEDTASKCCIDVLTTCSDVACKFARWVHARGVGFSGVQTIVILQFDLSAVTLSAVAVLHVRRTSSHGGDRKSAEGLRHHRAEPRWSRSAGVISKGVGCHEGNVKGDCSA